MESVETDFSRTIEVQAQTAELATVRQFVEDISREVISDPEKVFDLKVAVSEACANAIEHAGSNSAIIQVSARVHDKRLTFLVSDTGYFRTPSLPRPGHQSRGLGLPLMVALMDEVRFSRLPAGGTTVTLSVLV